MSASNSSGSVGNGARDALVVMVVASFVVSVAIAAAVAGAVSGSGSDAIVSARVVRLNGSQQRDVSMSSAVQSSSRSGPVSVGGPVNIGSPARVGPLTFKTRCDSGKEAQVNKATMMIVDDCERVFHGS